MGRPSKLDDLRAQKIVAAIRDGNTRECAAQLAGVHPDTLYEWVRRGATGEEPYAAFSERLRTADAEAEELAVKAVIAQFTSEKLGLGAATWWLERRRSATWGKRETAEEMSPDEAEQLVAEAAKLAGAK